MKALEKNRARRYESANDFAADIENFLTHKPVQAAAPTMGYMLAKTFRRHRVSIAVSGAFLLVLVGGIIASVSQAVRATRFAAAEGLARLEAQTNYHDARRNLYAADMSIAGQELAVNNLERAKTVLQRHIPVQGESDLRGWEWHYLSELCRDRSASTLTNFSYPLTDLVFSPSGNALFLNLVQQGSGISKWSWPERSFLGFTNEANGLAFSPKGTFAVLGGIGFYRICDPDSLTPVHAIQASVPLQSMQLVISPNEELLAVFGMVVAGEGAPYGAHAVFKLPEGKELFLAKHGFAGGHYRALAFSPDGAMLAVGDGLGRISFLRVEADGTFKKESHLSAHDEFFTGLTFSPDGRWLAASSGFNDPVIRLWDMKNDRRMRVLRGHTAWVRDLKFSKDSSLLASASADQTARLWSLPGGSVREVFRGHQNEVWLCAFSPDKSHLLTAAKDGEVKLWDLSSSAGSADLALPRFAGSGISFGLTPDHRQFSAVATGNVFRVSIPTGAPENMNSLGNSNEVAAISADGRFLLAGDFRGELRLFDSSKDVTATNLAAHSDRFHSVAFLPDARALSLGMDGKIRVWDTDLKELNHWDFPTNNYMRDRHFYAEAGFFATDGMSEAGKRNYQLRNITNGVLIAALEGPAQVLADLAMTPDRKTVVIADESGTISFWDAATWKKTRQLRGHLVSTWAMAVSPDGKCLATFGFSQGIKIWDMETLQEICRLPHTVTYSKFLSFSRDGKSLASQMSRNTMQLLRVPPTP